MACSETVRTFVSKWAFNDSLHALAQWMVGGKLWADQVMGALLVMVVGVLTFTRRVDVWRAAGLYLLVAVLLSTVHPWYVLWALMLVAVRFDPVVWVLSLLVVLAYEAQLHPWAFKPAVWVVWAEYVPVYAVGVWWVWWGMRAWRGMRGDVTAAEAAEPRRG